MRLKRTFLAMMSVCLVMGIASFSFAEPTEDFHVEPSTEPTEEATGPVVEEYMVYTDDDKRIEPGSLSGDVNLNTVGRGLYFDGTDFYFFMDTGIMATNFMYNIQGDRFFFGEDGKMVKNEMVSYDGEMYYFDINGAMYKNRWYTAEEVDVYENTITYTDYYFGPTGRAYRAGDGNSTGIVVKTIEEEKYGFNEDGEKIEGYYSLTDADIKDPDEDEAYANCDYYFDPQNNGAATTGWHYYSGSVRGDEYDNNEEIVLYFDEKTAKKVRSYSSDETRCIYRTIEGQRYAFDHNGVRRNKWYNLNPGVDSNNQTTPATFSDLRYFSEDYDGYLTKGWFTAIPPKTSVLEVNQKRAENDEDVWFYAGSNGKIYKSCIRKIGHYTYAFDDDGVMQEDCLVRVRGGKFIKSYKTETLYRGNVLNDVVEFGHAEGEGDNDERSTKEPLNLDRDKGLLKAHVGEQWMYFYSDQKGDDKQGAMCSLNTPIKIELNDTDVYLVCNSTGGYTIPQSTDITAYPTGTGVTQRNSKLIQNGCLLKANPDDNNYAFVRRSPQKVLARVINYLNQQSPANAVDEATGLKKVFKYVIVNTSGAQIQRSGPGGCLKDKQGGYIYYYGSSDNTQLLGYYSVQGRCTKLTTSRTDTYTKEDGTKVTVTLQPGQDFWEYKVDNKSRWTPGLPPERFRIKDGYYALNYVVPIDTTTVVSNYDCTGPCNDGIASWVYKDDALVPTPVPVTTP